MSAFLQQDSRANSVASSTGSTPSLLTSANNSKPTVTAVPFIQQLEDIDRKILEFRRNNQASRGHQHQHQHQQHNHHHHAPQLMQQAANQFRLQQPLPQQQHLQQQLQPRRSNSISPQYQLQQQPVSFASVQGTAGNIRSVPSSSQQAPPASALMGTANLSATSSISSASTTNSEMSSNFSQITARNGASANSNGSATLSQVSSFDNDLFSPKFNPFGGSSNAGMMGGFLNNHNHNQYGAQFGGDFSLANSGPSSLGSNLTLKQGFESSTGASDGGSGDASTTRSNIWNNDMSVWG